MGVGVGRWDSEREATELFNIAVFFRFGPLGYVLRVVRHRRKRPGANGEQRFPGFEDGQRPRNISVTMGLSPTATGKRPPARTV